jgi:hypothetical protein
MLVVVGLVGQQVMLLELDGIWEQLIGGFTHLFVYND